MNHIYYLGGSPCCGKSTIAEALANKHGLQYYKVDDFLDMYISRGSDDGNAWLKYVATLSLDNLWLRDPQILNEEELRTYENLFPYFIADLEKLDKTTPIITEGAAFLPNLVSQIGVNKSNYVCIVPTKEFQIENYAKRPWVNDYLSACSNKDRAFSNWMERDALFALSVLDQAKDLGYTTLIVDGVKSLEENILFIEKKLFS